MAKTGSGGKSVVSKQGGESGSGSGVENSEFDVASVGVGVSSTMWGGEGAGSKAQATLRADLQPTRNMDSKGPLGGPSYGGGTYSNNK